MKTKNLLFLILMFSVNLIFSQNPKIGQLTFIYPVGSNGFYSYKYSNNISINLLVGLNGGVEGIEIGGIGNINDSTVNGAQFSGIFNITKGDVNGIQVSPNLNLTQGNVSGAQINGLLNANTGNMTGLQVSGFMNINKGDVKQLQISGTLNSNYGNAEGLQIAGLMNSNLCKPEKKHTNLVQISGLINQHNSYMEGAQITSILNVTTDTLKGCQIGLVNIGTYVDGVQIGLININTNDSGKVIPLGLLNFVKGGVFDFELTAGDLLYSNLSYKMGVEKFYTVFKAGYSIYAGNSVYSYGLGLGRYFKINEKNKIALDLTFNNLSDNLFMISRNEVLTKLDLNYKHKLTKNISFLIGPSLNYYVAENYGHGENSLMKPIYSFANDEFYNFYSFTWVGANAGISISF